MFNRIIKFSLEHRLLVVCVAAFVLIYGGYVVFNDLAVDIFPDLNKPTVTVFTEAPGLAPEEVEVQVTLPLEYAINGATNVDRIRSQSGVGLSLLFVEFGWDSDIYRDRQIVAEKLELARARLPNGLTPVLGPISSIMGEIMLVALQPQSAKTSPMDVYSYAYWEVRPRLLAVSGVSGVNVIGGGEKQYQVLASADKLREYNVTFHELEAAVGSSNENTSGGFLIGPNNEMMVRNIGRTTRLQDVGNTVVAYRKDQPIYVNDLAKLQYGTPVMRGSAGFNAGPAVILSVYKQPNANTIPLTKSVEEALESMRPSMNSAGVSMNTHVFRQADFIQRSIDNVRDGLWQGAALVAVILFLFLLNFRTTIINLTAIPASFLITFLFMRVFGLGVNTMTLGGLAVAIGLIIDDAIVDVENVFRRLKENHERGEPERPLEVIFKASSEIRNSIVYATFIIVLVFLPLFVLPGVEGRMFAPLGVAFIVSLLASLLISLTLTPVMCYYLLPRAGFMGSHGDPALVRWLKKQQTRLLHFTLPHAWEVLIAAAFLVLLAIAFIPLMGREFLPDFNEGTFTVNVEAQPGISLAKSDEIGRLAERQILGVKGVVSTGRRTGRAELDEHAEGVYYNEIEVNVDKSRDKEAIRTDIRNQLAVLPGVTVNIGQPITHRLEHMQSGTNAAIAVKLFGDDLPTLRQKASEIDQIMMTVPGVVDVAVEKQDEVPEVRVAVDRQRAAQYGLQVAEINQVMETALNGRQVSQILDGQRVYDLVVRLDEPYRNDLGAIGNVMIDLPGGGKIPVSQVANISIGSAPNLIMRENGRRRIVVQANVSGRDLRSAVGEVEERVGNQVKLPPGYFIIYGGEFEYEEQATRLILILSIFALLGVFIMLYGHFQDIPVTLQIMSNIPLALVGGVIAIYWSGGVLSVASMIGFITVGGIAARNGIMMISHYIHLVRYEGERFDEAMIFRGTLERLRPVLMTALAAILGVLPLVLAKGDAGKELLQPIAIVITGGLISSTLLDWMVTPALFYKFGRGVCERYIRSERDTSAIAETSTSPALSHGD